MGPRFAQLGPHAVEGRWTCIAGRSDCGPIRLEAECIPADAIWLSALRPGEPGDGLVETLAGGVTGQTTCSTWNMEGLAPGQHVTTSVTDKTSLVHVWSGQWGQVSFQVHVDSPARCRLKCWRLVLRRPTGTEPSLFQVTSRPASEDVPKGGVQAGTSWTNGVPQELRKWVYCSACDMCTPSG